MNREPRVSVSVSESLCVCVCACLRARACLGIAYVDLRLHVKIFLHKYCE